VWKPEHQRRLHLRGGYTPDAPLSGRVLTEPGNDLRHHELRLHQLSAAAALHGHEHLHAVSGGGAPWACGAIWLSGVTMPIHEWVDRVRSAHDRADREEAARVR